MVIRFDAIITRQSHVAREVLCVRSGFREIPRGMAIQPKQRPNAKSSGSAIFQKTRLASEHVFRKDTFTPSCLRASRLNGNGITALSALPAAKCERPPRQF